MLEKTHQLLRRLENNNSLEELFDESEISELASFLRDIMYRPVQIRERLQELGVTITPSDFYSEIPTIKDIRDCSDNEKDVFDQVFDDQHMLDFIDELGAYSSEFDPPIAPTSDPLSVPLTFAWENGSFSYSDAMAYFCMIRKFRPRTILEVGSGWSTVVANMACRKNGYGSIICVEPYPSHPLHSLEFVSRIVKRSVQTLDSNYFEQNLDNDNDVLFIDSTHTVKHGSDCVHLYLKILPKLSHKLLVHAHDIYLPWPMPSSYGIDRQVYWTEQYLLYAYLLKNPSTKVLFSSWYHYCKNNIALSRFMGKKFASGGGSFWFMQN